MCASMSDVFAGQHGGGLAVVVPQDLQPGTMCASNPYAEPAFTTFVYSSVVSIAHAVVTENAVGSTASGVGGGISVGPGGLVLCTDCNVTENAASGLGGGLFVGSSSSGNVTAGLTLQGCNVTGNTARQAGAQIYFASMGSMSVANATLGLGTGGSQVRESKYALPCLATCCTINMEHLVLARPGGGPSGPSCRQRVFRGQRFHLLCCWLKYGGRGRGLVWQWELPVAIHLVPRHQRPGFIGKV
jgi:hypothetical protein